MSEYRMNERKSHIPRRIRWVGGILLAILVVAAIIVHFMYTENLRPVSNNGKSQVFTVATDSSLKQIAVQLKQAGLIRDTRAFELYVAVHDERDKLQAGTYKFSPSESVQQIVDALVHGKVATDLVTIVPGARIDQIRQSFINAGFKPAAIDAALQAGQYRADYPALADNPASSTLEGFLYPDSYQKTASTDPRTIVEEALTEMQNHLTASIRASFASEGLTTYQGVTLASIVEQEVSSSTDRPQVAQVFLTRLKKDMPLGSDVTAFYGAIKAGVAPTTSYDSPYNTLLHKGLPPGPIGGVSDSSLQAVAHPARTDWLYFVTGDDGVTHFSKTLQQHEAYTQQYCHKLCVQAQ
ncbi:MAG TPA: endolytic transglycosylase MltG [Candidatus Saccharimonadales bacterium]|nr:endolytic transglycosylase MltG [Candidatus Saccharimonadales bacterium]